jgi:hypothetical protein
VEVHREAARGDGEAMNAIKFVGCNKIDGAQWIAVIAVTFIIAVGCTFYK